MASSARQAYFWRAVNSLRSFSNDELAFSEFEAVAKLVESSLGATPFQPHHLTAAKNYLLDSGELATETSGTRGGREVPLLVTGHSTGRSKEISEMAGRKRLLLGRYYGFTQGSASMGEGLSGAAAEIAVHGAIQRAGVGTSMAATFRDRPSVSELLGKPVPLGPLDNAFMLQPLTEELLPKPPYGILVPVEVKNIREWVYPHTRELFQLLAKGSLLQRLHPDRPVIPLFVCRRLHPTTTFMAKALGFFAIDAHRQYFPTHSRIEVDKLDEIRRELGLADLTQDLASTGRIEAGLRAFQRKYDVELAAHRWAGASKNDDFVYLIEQLRTTDQPAVRSRLMRQLRIISRQLGAPAGW